jgi:hypothetical protein
MTMVVYIHFVLQQGLLVQLELLELQALKGFKA